VTSLVAPVRGVCGFPTLPSARGIVRLAAQGGKHGCWRKRRVCIHLRKCGIAIAEGFEAGHGGRRVIDLSAVARILYPEVERCGERRGGRLESIPRSISLREVLAVVKWSPYCHYRVRLCLAYSHQLRVDHGGIGSGRGYGRSRSGMMYEVRRRYGYFWCAGREQRGQVVVEGESRLMRATVYTRGCRIGFTRFPFRPSSPIQSNAVVACLALPFAIGTSRLLFATIERLSYEHMWGWQTREDYHLTLRALQGL
jgi:hypothetical protein